MTPARFRLTLVSNFRNENVYLREWLAYHQGIGVDHVTLYDQDGSEEAREIVAPFEASGFATRHLWTNLPSLEGPTRFYQKNRKHMAYIHAANACRNKTRWLLKLDIDEFLFPLDDTFTWSAWLDSLERVQARGVRIPRIDFGSSGHKVRPEGGVPRNYVMREASPSNYKEMGSTAALTDNRTCYSSHRWAYRWFPRGPLLTEPANIPLRINHYYTKSREEFLQRQNISRGRDNTEEGFKRIDERLSQCRDDSILPLLARIFPKSR